MLLVVLLGITIASEIIHNRNEPDRHSLMNSKFYIYYKQFIEDDDRLRNTIFKISYNSHESNSMIFFDILTSIKAACRILTEEYMKPLLYLMINTKKLKSDIWSTSPVTYFTVSHVYRIYNYCVQEEILYTTIKENKTSDQELYDLFLKIFDPTANIRESGAFNDFLLKLKKFTSKLTANSLFSEFNLSKSIFRNDDTNYCKYLLDLEMSYMKQDILCMQEHLKNSYEATLHKAYAQFIPYSDILYNHGKYMLLENGQIRFIRKAWEIHDFYQSTNIHYPFKDTLISPNYRPCKDYFLDLEGMKILLNYKIHLNKTLCEIFFVLLLYYSGVHQELFLLEINNEPESVIFTIKIVCLERSQFVTNVLDYYRYILFDEEQTKMEILQKTEMGQNCGFVTLVDQKYYTFAKPHPDAYPIGYRCLQLSCGHFIGQELISEYLFQEEERCRECNSQSIIIKYFEMPFYEQFS